MRAVLYDVEWQRLRVSLLGSWNGSVQENIDKLRDYVGDGSDSCKVYRVLNCLNAVRMGYSGQGLRGTQDDEAVRLYRDSLPSYDKSTVQRVATLWDWGKVAEDLEVLKSLDWTSYIAIRANLEGRRTFAYKKVGTMSHRTELQRFLELVA